MSGSDDMNFSPYDEPDGINAPFNPEYKPSSYRESDWAALSPGRVVEIPEPTVIYGVFVSNDCYECGGPGVLERAYYDEDEANTFVSRRSQFPDEDGYSSVYVVQPIRIGRPDVQYEGPVWRWRFGRFGNAGVAKQYWHSGDMPPEFQVIRDGAATFEIWGLSKELVLQWGANRSAEIEQTKRDRAEYRKKNCPTFGPSFERKIR